MHSVRSERDTNRSVTDALFFSIVTKGQTRITQDGREATIAEGGLYLLDASRPFTVTMGVTTEHLVVEMPRGELEARIGSTRLVTGRAIVGSDREASLAAAFVATLRQRSLTDSVAAASLASQTIDLAALALTRGDRETARRLTSPAAMSRLRLHHAIDACLQDRIAHCDDVAAMAGISTRYANMLLSQEGTTLERLIMRRRLERCRMSLDDPGQFHLSIGEIAYRWGFESQSHFARYFKNAYGITASDYRHRAGTKSVA